MRLLLAAFCGGLVGTFLPNAYSDWHERQSYAALIEAKDALARDVEMCRRQTNRLGIWLTRLETAVKRRRR